MKHLKNILAVIVGCSVFCAASICMAEDDNVLQTINKLHNDLPIDNHAGYKYVFSFAMVSKGASGYVDPNDFNNLYYVLKKADNEDQLTPEGKQLLNLVYGMRNDVGKMSKNMLTQIGNNNVGDLGSTYIKNRKDLVLSKANQDKETGIQFVYDGNALSLATGERFVMGMTKQIPEDNSIAYEEVSDDKILDFSHSNDYKLYLNSYPDLEKVLGRLRVTKQNKSYIANVLPRIFKSKLISELEHIGVMIDSSTLTKIESSDFVTDLFEFYQLLPTIDIRKAEDSFKLINTLMRPEERSYFAAQQDARLFYRFGPGFNNNQIALKAGQDIIKTYVDDIKNASEDNSDGPLKLYFVDPRSMLSVITFISGDRLPQSMSPKTDYDVLLDNFKVSHLVPLNSIMIWDLYRDKNGNIFVDVTLNGDKLLLTSSCVANNGYYEWKTLQTCLNLVVPEDDAIEKK